MPRRLIEEGGADVVKLERGDSSICEMIRHIVSHDIPVCAHLGLTPQSIEELGGYKVQGRDPACGKTNKTGCPGGTRSRCFHIGP